MKTLKDIDVKDKIVLVRADYNVPLSRDEEGAGRLQAILEFVRVCQHYFTYVSMAQKRLF